MNAAITLEHLSALSARSFSSHEEAMETVLHAVGEFLGMRTSFLSNISRKDNRLTVVGAHSFEGGLPLAAGMEIPLSHAFCDMIASAPVLAPLVLEDVRHNPRALAHPSTKAFPGVGSYIGVPVTLTDGTFFGTLCAADAEIQSFSSQHPSLMIVLARLLATQIEREQELIQRRYAESCLRQAHYELQEAHDSLATLAITDPVTDLPNHRAVLSAVDSALAHARQREEHCAVCFVDLDHFKTINDTYGHTAGDSVLYEVGQLICRHIRQHDFFGRWGGEEFVTVINIDSETDALKIAERLRSLIANHLFPIGDGIRLTASLGVAISPLHAIDRSSLIDAADKAMYEAKRAGRNQVHSASGLVVEPCLDVKPEVFSQDADFSLSGTVEALAFLVDSRDHYTGEHTEEVRSLASQLGESMALSKDEVRMLSIAARLHDVGKIAIPDAILNKPGKLTSDEWMIMQRHAALGADIVNHFPALCTIAPVIRAHHERWDGAGYPDQLVAEQIPLGSRIIAVADSYGAMTTNRPYRQASSPEWALAELRRCAGSQFDPAVVEAFAQFLLQDGLIANEVAC